MLEYCEQWRFRNMPNDLLGDVFDGRVWKEFRVINEKPFLDNPYTFFAFSLNRYRTRKKLKRACARTRKYLIIL